MPVSTQTVEAAGVALCVERGGSGPPVVLVHGTACDRRVWRELVEALGDGFDTIAYDRRGYGDSDAPEPYEGTTVAEQTDDLIALLEALAPGPAVVCGHALGALIALDLTVREPALVRGALLLDPPMLWLSPQGPERVATTRLAVERGARERGRAGAVEAFLVDAAGPGVADVLGTERMNAARTAIRAFAADLAAAASWSVARRSLRAIERPITIVHANAAAPLLADVGAALAALLKNVSSESVASTYFVQVQAPRELTPMIAALAGGAGV